MLYPMNLVACEERFGSWMVQYGYANYITAEKLLEMGHVTADGKIRLAGRTFTTLVALFEILPQPGLLEMMQRLAENGGSVIWSGPPPLIDGNGKNCQAEWQALFGVKYAPSTFQGQMAAGKTVTFKDTFSTVPEQTILTDFIVDRIYPVDVSDGSEIVANIGDQVIGAKRKYGKGQTCFLGFRPRDDQSASLGREQRTWVEILYALGAYPPTGRFTDANDNTEYLSRSSDYLTTRFPNGTTVIARHYRRHAESWPGGFSRDKAEDEKIIRQNPLPSDRIRLQNFKVNGHQVRYDGRLVLAFNTDERGDLVAFEGHNCDRIIIDGKKYIFSAQKQPYLAWAPVAAARQIPEKAFFQIFLQGSGEISIPFTTDRKNLKLFTQGRIPGAKGKEVPFKFENGRLKIKADAENTNRWLYLTGAL